MAQARFNNRNTKVSNKIDRITPLRVLNYSLITLFSFICLIPMVLVIMISFTAESAIKANGYQLFPQQLTIEAYRLLFTPSSSIFPAYVVSLSVTFIGTLLAVTITAMAAFTLCNKNVHYRNTLAVFFFIPMVFNAGLVPWYMMNRALGLTNNLFALIVPSLMFSAYNMFLCCANGRTSHPAVVVECRPECTC